MIIPSHDGIYTFMDCYMRNKDGICAYNYYCDAKRREGKCPKGYA